MQARYATVRPHLYALEQLAVDIKTANDAYRVMVPKAPFGDDRFVRNRRHGNREYAHGGNTGIPGMTTVKFASANYMVQDVCFLRKAWCED